MFKLGNRTSISGPFSIAILVYWSVNPWNLSRWFQCFFFSFFFGTSRSGEANFFRAALFFWCRWYNDPISTSGYWRRGRHSVQQLATNKTARGSNVEDVGYTLILCQQAPWMNLKLDPYKRSWVELFLKCLKDENPYETREFLHLYLYHNSSVKLSSEVSRVSQSYLLRF